MKGSLQRARLAIAAHALAVLALCCFSASASAEAEYQVKLCTAPGTAPALSDGIFSIPQGPVPGMFAEGCRAEGEGIVQGSRGARAARDEALSWALISPQDTRIASLELTTTLNGADAGTSSFLSWELFTADRELTTGGRLLDQLLADDGRFISPNPSTRKLVVDAQALISRLSCKFDTCPGFATPGAFSISFKGFDAVFVDERAPVVTNPVFPSRPLRGDFEIPVGVVDGGAGIDSVSFLLDGVERLNFHSDNGGRCQRPYRFVQPCIPEVNGGFTLDTTSLSNGEHTLQLVATDAAGQKTSSTIVPFVVDNSPLPPAPPGGGGGKGPRGDHKAPVLSRITLSRKLIRLTADVGGSEETRLGFTSSEGGKLSIVISRVRGGKRPPKRVITLAARVKRGRSIVPLTATLGDKTLGPGLYEIKTTVRDDAGNVSKPDKRTLRIRGR